MTFWRKPPRLGRHGSVVPVRPCPSAHAQQRLRAPLLGNVNKTAPGRAGDVRNATGVDGRHHGTVRALGDKRPD